METAWQFQTAQFTVRARIVEDHDADLSFDETGETREKVASGEWLAFGTIVEVLKNGRVIGSDSLWGSIYAEPREFFESHWKSDAEGRNTLAMKAHKRAVCHYFPDMVRQAIEDARRTLG